MLTYEFVPTPHDWEEDGPCEDDVIIWTDRGSYAYTWNTAPAGYWHPDNLTDMLAAIRADMDREQFWPNIWLEHERGGYDLIRIIEED